MRKEFEFKLKAGKFVLSKKGVPDDECFAIDADNLQFDCKKFYEGIFFDVNECIEIDIINQINPSEDVEQSTYKKAKHIYDSIKSITEEICIKLNEQCFTSEQ